MAVASNSKSQENKVTQKGPVSEETKEKITAEGKRLADGAKAEGKRLVDEAKSVAFEQTNKQKDAAADYVASLASAINSGREELKDQGYNGTAELVSGAVDGLSNLAKNVSERPPEELYREVENFARQRPGLFFGAAFLVGFGLTRFLKSSSENQQNSASTDRSDLDESRSAGAGGSS